MSYQIRIYEGILETKYGIDVTVLVDDPEDTMFTGENTATDQLILELGGDPSNEDGEYFDVGTPLSFDCNFQDVVLPQSIVDRIRASAEKQEKFLLVSSDSFGIVDTQYDSLAEAQDAMRESYEALVPADWEEDWQDMSYCHDESALLYKNGENVYTWKIIRVAL